MVCLFLGEKEMLVNRKAKSFFHHGWEVPVLLGLVGMVHHCASLQQAVVHVFHLGAWTRGLQTELVARLTQSSARSLRYGKPSTSCATRTPARKATSSRHIACRSFTERPFSRLTRKTRLPLLSFKERRPGRVRRLRRRRVCPEKPVAKGSHTFVR